MRSCYAINKNVDGLRLRDVGNDIILIYESNIGWNNRGEGENIRMRHWKGHSIMYVMFASGQVEFFAEEKIIREPLKWKE